MHGEQKAASVFVFDVNLCVCVTKGKVDELSSQVKIKIRNSRKKEKKNKRNSTCMQQFQQ